MDQNTNDAINLSSRGTNSTNGPQHQNTSSSSSTSSETGHGIFDYEPGTRRSPRQSPVIQSFANNDHHIVSILS